MLRCVYLVASVLCLTQINQATEDALHTSDVTFRFTEQLYNVSIPENSVAKTYAAQSPGAPRMGVQVAPNTFTDIRYKIIEGDKDRFFKAEQRLVGDFCFLFIRIKTGNNDVLNRERKDKYILQVRATASIKEGKQKVQYTSDTIVVVTVLDTNDLSPLFYPMEYNATVSEDTPVHQSIVKVIAEDADLGRNGEIYYSFAEDTDKFAIHPVTGIITLTRPLIYNEGTYHELTVFAQDRGGHSGSGPGFSRAKVRIRVKKVNLYAPEIRIRRHPTIVENSNADIYAIVNVSDRDDGIHGEIDRLEIVDGDPDGHFRIRPTRQKGEYNIEVLKLLDREKTPQGYQLQLKAVDKGVPPRESYKLVPVQLADLNDNAPVFNKEIYDVKVPESAPVNTPLIRLKVTDADEGRNAQVFLEIVGGNEGGEFHINPETGMLYTVVLLDAENKQFYSLTVSAIDQGNVGTRKQSSAKVKIYVEDTNDNDPIFDKSEVTVWIDENLPAGTSVTTVHAKDKDRGENAYISYLIANLNKVPFEVDHFSGIIKTTQLLDYESMRREYVLRVRASDWGLPYRRQTEMQLTVKVRDINDNRPQFEKIDCVGNIPRHIPIGSEIITLSAIDFDSGNIISYRIVSGNEDNCFNIDSTAGTITVSCDLNDVRVSERELNVTATDNTHFADIARVRFKLVNTKKNVFSSGRLLTDDTGVFDCKDTGVARRLTEVLAEAENNNSPSEIEDFPMMPTRYGQNVHAPEFVDFPIEIKVNESVSLGTSLVKLKARDRDLGYNGKLIYGLSGGDTHSQFCIDMETGELKVIGYLDREREYEYFLNVTVYDLGKPQKSSSRVLPITVLDVNDNAPKFEKSLASFRVTENALNGTAIFRANATDLDEGDNAKVTYSLATDTNDFIVDKVTGILTVANALDRERQDLYELRIRATDNGGKGPDNPPLFSEAIVRISIDDINDNAPKFSLPNYNVKIREDVPKGTVVAVVTASDPDLGPDGEVQYSLEDSDSDGTFKIDKLSGTIRTTKPLDFEERQVHSLMVFAYDRGNPSLSSEATVTINVVDVNENMYAPSFSDAVLTGKVYENREVGTIVMNVSAVDLDPPGGDSMVEYSIKGGDGIGLFSIDNEGIIKTTAILDIETKSHYWLTIFAQDHGVVPLFSSVEVYIEVLNENDNVPLSELPVYYPVVQEDSPAGTFILQIKTTDRDKDSNQHITYRIASGNPEGFFTINSTTGAITTTARKLDRETQDEHILELNWTNARDACKAMGMVLASTATFTEQLDLKTYLREHSLVPKDQYSGYWIGYSRQSTYYPWILESNGQELGQFGWLPGEPNGYEGEDCLEFKKDGSSMGWNNYYCYDLRGYICERLPFTHEPKKNFVQNSKDTLHEELLKESVNAGGEVENSGSTEDDQGVFGIDDFFIFPTKPVKPYFVKAYIKNNDEMATQNSETTVDNQDVSGKDEITMNPTEAVKPYFLNNNYMTTENSETTEDDETIIDSTIPVKPYFPNNNYMETKNGDTTEDDLDVSKDLIMNSNIEVNRHFLNHNYIQSFAPLDQEHLVQPDASDFPEPLPESVDGDNRESFLNFVDRDNLEPLIEPVDTNNEEPLIEPVDINNEEPLIEPVDTNNEEPLIEPVDTNNEEPLIEPVDTNNEEPLIEPVDTNNEEPLIEPVDTNNEEPLIEPVDTNNEEPLAEPVEIDNQQPSIEALDNERQELLHQLTKTEEHDLEQIILKSKDFSFSKLTEPEVVDQPVNSVDTAYNDVDLTPVQSKTIVDDYDANYNFNSESNDDFAYSEYY